MIPLIFDQSPPPPRRPRPSGIIGYSASIISNDFTSCSFATTSTSRHRYGILQSAWPFCVNLNSIGARLRTATGNSNRDRSSSQSLSTLRDVLHTTTTNLPTPNLPFIAKNEETYEKETCVLVGLILAIVVKVRSSFSRRRSVAAEAYTSSRVVRNKSTSMEFLGSNNGYRGRLCGRLKRWSVLSRSVSIVHDR